MKKLVIYYSLEGNSRNTAREIARRIDADTAEIKPVNPISATSPMRFVKGGMQSLFEVEQEIKEVPVNLASYDEIILAAPVWAGKCAAPMWSFVKKNNQDLMKDRVVGAVCLSGSGSTRTWTSQMHKQFPNLRSTASLVDGRNKASRKNPLKLRSFLHDLQYGL